MSPFKSDCLRVSLDTDRIALVKTVGCGRLHIDADLLLAVELNPDHPEAGLAPLAAELATGRWRCAHGQVVLADPLVHYFVATALPGTQDLAEMRQLLESRCEELFGRPAADWEIDADLSPFATRFLACAASHCLLAEIRRLFALAGQPLDAIQPFFVAEFNHWRRRLGRRSAWFATRSGHCLTLALHGRDGWQGIRTHGLGDEGLERLPSLLARDQVAYGQAGEPGPVWLAGTGSPIETADPIRVNLADLPAWPGHSEAWSREYRLALAGVWP